MQMQQVVLLKVCRRQRHNEGREIMKKHFGNLNMLVILLLAGLVIAGTCANVLAGAPNPGLTDSGKTTGPAISGTITYYFDGSGACSFTNVTCKGDEFTDFQGEHTYPFPSEIYRENIVGNEIPVPVELLGDCIPQNLDPYAPFATVVIKVVHSIKETEAGNITAEAVLMFVN